MITLTNNNITISVKEHGAELASIKKNGREYLWQGYPEFWARHSPVLFPIVGSVFGGEYRSHDKTFNMGQHGFARDMDFTLVSKTDTEVFFELNSSEETLVKYPYPFHLVIGYRLNGNTISVIWKVENTGTEEMAFQIGAHPAFYWPMLSNEEISQGVEAMNKHLAEESERGYFLFEGTKDCIVCNKMCNGFVANEDITYPLENGYMKLNRDSFDEPQTFIIENSQVTAVTLCDEAKSPYLTVKFDAPLVGLWSPDHKSAPFVCIEPWYGRCDYTNYDGQFESRQHMQHLAPGATFETKYEVEVLPH